MNVTNTANGDFCICAIVEGKEYAEFLQERGTKTRLGESE